MDKARVTPKDFFLWAGAMVALYWTVISFILLVFNYVDYTFLSPASNTPIDPYQSGVGHEMASIIVLLPIYFIVMWVIRRDIHRDASRKNIWVRRWALILTLFVTGITIAVDLITVLTTYLNGESFTIAFLIKALLVLLVAAVGFMHFIADFWGYWDQYPDRKRAVGIAVAVLAVAVIVSGFFIIGTPMQAMAYREDEQKVSDLQTIQNEVVTYWQENGVLPTSLDAVGQPLTGQALPVDEQTGKEYQYQILGKMTFQLCATFNAETAAYAISQSEYVVPAPAVAGGSAPLPETWYHESGNQCFIRTINPAQYPRIKAQ